MNNVEKKMVEEIKKQGYPNCPVCGDECYSHIAGGWACVEGCWAGVVGYQLANSSR